MNFEIFTEEDRQQEREMLASYDLDVRFFDKLGLKVKQIVPERNCFRIEAHQGFFCLKKMDLLVDDIYIMQEMAEYLKKKDFESIFEIILQSNKEILVPYGGSHYYLTKWMDGRESDYLNLFDIKSAVEALAQFHLASEGFQSKYDIKHRRLYGRWREGFVQKLIEIETAKNQVTTVDGKNEQTQIITGYLESCEKSAKHALQLLEHSSYDRLNQRDENKQGFIHHDFGFHNILHTFDNETYIGGLESYAFDIKVHDLGHFIYRLMRRRGWDIESALDIISYYNEVNRLEKEDYQVLAAYFAFPHDCKQFYRQHYIAVKEVEDLEELEKINIESEYNQAKKEFLNEFEKYSRLL